MYFVEKNGNSWRLSGAKATSSSTSFVADFFLTTKVTKEIDAT
ncbi:hypothetical protein [uncultured Chryseobacterium sp.]|nr:hypothetical protein [uncultured Chryseobacterium sp.]